MLEPSINLSVLGEKDECKCVQFNRQIFTFLHLVFLLTDSNFHLIEKHLMVGVKGRLRQRVRVTRECFTIEDQAALMEIHARRLSKNKIKLKRRKQTRKHGLYQTTTNILHTKHNILYVNIFIHNQSNVWTHLLMQFFF